MKGLEELLGFRISGNQDSCLDHRRIEILDAVTGNIKATRPATLQEVELWQALLDYERHALEREEVLKVKEAQFRGSQAAMEADNLSLRASCNAYRDELEKLRVYAIANRVTPQEPSESVSTLELMAQIVQSHNAQKKRLLDKAREIWQIEPGVDIIDFMFRQLQHINGEMAVDTERRRMDYINRVAGEQVQK